MAERIARRYLKLGLRLGRHVDGIVDSYAGPPELAESVEAEPLRDPAELAADAEELLGEVDDGWLRDQVRGLHTTRVVHGRRAGSYADEVEGCYGFRPAHTDESVFEAAQGSSIGCCPGMAPGRALRELAEVDDRPAGPDRADGRRPYRGGALVDARVVELPDGEGVDLEVVHDRPWLAFCEYQGGLRSQISVNADLPISAFELLHVACHETYPGHHAERVCKDDRLVRAEESLEETLVLMPTPQSLVSEGIAELGSDLLLSSEGGDGLAAVLATAAGVELDLAHAVAVSRAREPCGWAEVNASLMLHEDGASRGRGPGLPRALGAQDAGVRRPRDPLHDRAELAHLHRELLGRARAVPRVRGRRLGRLPPPAHEADPRERPALEPVSAHAGAGSNSGSRRSRCSWRSLGASRPVIVR